MTTQLSIDRICFCLITSFIPNISTSWRSHHATTITGQKSHGYPQNRRLGGPQSPFGLFGEKTNPSYCMVTAPTELPQFSLSCSVKALHPFICSCIYDQEQLNTVGNSGHNTRKWLVNMTKESHVLIFTGSPKHEFLLFVHWKANSNMCWNCLTIIRLKRERGRGWDRKFNAQKAPELCCLSFSQRSDASLKVENVRP